jgi:hypothetical protein
MPMSPSLSRRSLLSALGLGGASLFLPTLLPRRARAAEGAPPPDEGAPPKRLLIFYTSHGTVYDNWKMRPAGKPEDADWEHSLSRVSESEMSPILRPLYEVREDLLVLDGLSLATAIADVVWNEHPKGQINSLTGSALSPITADQATSSNASVDQIVAKAIARPDRLPSLEVSIGGSLAVAFRGPGEAVPFESSAKATFDRLFPAGSTPPGGVVTNADRVRAAQGSMLDLVQGEYDRTSQRLSVEDRKKLDLHRDLVRDLEKRVGTLSAAQCTAPGQPTDVPLEESGWYRKRHDLFTSLVTTAFACDLTRVVTMFMAEMPNDFSGALDVIHLAAVW